MDNPSNFILVPKGQDYVMVALEDIIYFAADTSGSMLYCVNEVKYFTTKNLKELETLMSDDHFFRIHHSYLVAVNHITGIHGKGDLELEMSNGMRIPISRRKRKDFLNMFLKL